MQGVERSEKIVLRASLERSAAGDLPPDSSWQVPSSGPARNLTCFGLDPLFFCCERSSAFLVVYTRRLQAPRARPYLVWAPQPETSAPFSCWNSGPAAPDNWGWAGQVTSIRARRRLPLGRKYGGRAAGEDRAPFASGMAPPEPLTSRSVVTQNLQLCHRHKRTARALGTGFQV